MESSVVGEFGHVLPAHRHPGAEAAGGDGPPGQIGCTVQDVDPRQQLPRRPGELGRGVVPGHQRQRGQVPCSLVQVSGLGVRAFDMLATMVESLPPASDPAADLVAAGTLGFRPFALKHPALFRIGIQQTYLAPEVARTIVPAAECALPALHRRIALLRDAGSLGSRAVPEAACEFHAACEGLAALEMRGWIRPEDGHRIWHDTLSALVTGWQQT